MTLDFLPWLILFLPLAAAAGITLFTLKNRALSAKLSIGAIVTCFVLTLVLIQAGGWAPRETSVNWLDVGNLHVDFGLRLDVLSLMMLLVVTGVGGAIHIYSYGYMHEDRSLSRYFASLSFFTFSMLGIVLATNFLQMFIFWELVGVSSYLLIGFWYDKPSAADASKKAFLTNRIGDFGFMLGILMVWSFVGSLNFTTVQDAIKTNPAIFGSLATLVGVLVFMGAMGKSAQFPLHVWLPDAMEGPTPVSALIHAATMVAAGVYMLCRVFFIFTPDALQVIAWIGAITALLAALIAVQQNDIKRILAYSTLSQLGYMVMAVGLSAQTAAMYHLTTHAFFKALLFLGAGSVIYALHHEQDIWKMGGLRRRMPVTFWTFLIATLALCGVPPLSGFYSKDEILAAGWEHDKALFAVAALVAVLTTFYMFRLVFVAFLGKERSESAHHACESPRVMTWPLLALCVATVLGGFWGVKPLFEQQFARGGPTLAEPAVSWAAELIGPFQHAPVPAVTGLAAFALGLWLAFALYGKAKDDPLPYKLVALSRAMRNRFYFDELYEATVIKLHDFIAAVANSLDIGLTCLVRFTHGTTELSGRALRLFQTGNLQTYAFLFALGVAVVLWFVIGK